jgi:hypothetical protein
MEYWRGWMNWPLAKNWTCPTCGNCILVWGFIHAQCRCDTCHTQFMMRDENKKIVTVPICLLKEEYKEPAKAAFEYFKKPIDKLYDDEWDFAFSECME